MNEAQAPARYDDRPAEWTEKFSATDCCITPILRADEAISHPLFQARMMVRKQHPTEGPYWSTRPAVKFRN